MQDKINEAFEKIEKGVQDIFQNEQYKEYLKMASKFHKYSYRNTILIFAQNPDATFVKGYVAWRNDFNRQVRKSEKGISIIVPQCYKRDVETVARDAQGEPILVNGKIERQKKEVTVPAFRAVTVFDVSQTEGAPLPEPPELVKQLEGDIANYAALWDAIRKQSTYDLVLEPMEGRNGYCQISLKKRAVRDGMSQMHTIKTAVHETAHSLLHSLDSVQTTSAREVEAESVAFIACDHFGFDTSDFSFGYIAEWSKGKDLSELKHSLALIQKTSASLIDGIQRELEKNLVRQVERDYKIEIPI